MKRFTLTVIAVAFAAVGLFASDAHAAVDYPITQAPVVVSCSLVTVDPPTPINVYLHGTIDGQPVELTVEAAQVNGHEAEFDISAFTQGFGDLPYVLWATWDLGTGNSPKAQGVLHCNDEPTTTTSTSTSTTTTITSIPVTTSTTNPCDHFARGVATNDARPGAAACITPAIRIGTPTTATRELPMTGAGGVIASIALGVALAIVGIMCIEWARRRNA